MPVIVIKRVCTTKRNKRATERLRQQSICISVKETAALTSLASPGSIKGTYQELMYFTILTVFCLCSDCEIAPQWLCCFSFKTKRLFLTFFKITNPWLELYNKIITICKFKKYSQKSRDFWPQCLKKKKNTFSTSLSKKKTKQNREFVFTRASWVLSQMVLMTCAPAEAAPLFALDWWHMLSRRAISRARTPQCPGETPCNPSTTVTQWQRQTLNKQRVWLCLSLSLHCISICFFLSPTPPTVSVSPCYFFLPSVVHPSSAFSPNVPTEADLMDDPLLWRLGSPWGPLPSSVGICVWQSDSASSGRRLPLSVSVCMTDIRGFI